MQLPPVRYLNLSTGPLAYRRGGEGTPLLLIHGWGGSSRYWLGAYVTLAEYYDVIAIDLPGCGESPPPHGPASLLGLSQVVSETIDALELGVLAVAGHSLGAALALLLAAARPHQIRRMALVSFGLPRSAAEESLLASMHIALRANATLWAPWLALWTPWLTAIRPWNQIFWMTPPLPILLAAQAVHRLDELPYAALALGAADLASMDARVAIETASSTGDPLVIAAARQIQTPTLVIAGREDALFPPAASTALAHTLPNAALLLLERCGHVPMAESPAPFYTTLGVFLAS